MNLQDMITYREYPEKESKSNINFKENNINTNRNSQGSYNNSNEMNMRYIEGEKKTQLLWSYNLFINNQKDALNYLHLHLNPLYIHHYSYYFLNIYFFHHY